RPRRWSGALLLLRRHSIISVASFRWFTTIRISTALKDRVGTMLCRPHRSRFIQRATKHKKLNSRGLWQPRFNHQQLRKSKSDLCRKLGPEMAGGARRVAISVCYRNMLLLRLLLEFGSVSPQSA